MKFIISIIPFAPKKYAVCFAEKGITDWKSHEVDLFKATNSIRNI